MNLDLFFNLLEAADKKASIKFGEGLDISTSF